MNQEHDTSFVSRGGHKLKRAIDHFGLVLDGWICADLGANVGGFTDCLIQHRAKRVYSVDTAYGELAWPLRQHPNVIALERVNAIHFDPRKASGVDVHGKTGKKIKIPSLPDFENGTGVNLVVIDLGWTPQKRALPAAMHWLKSDFTEPVSRIISLIKPHYEVDQSIMRSEANDGVLPDNLAFDVADQVARQMHGLNLKDVPGRLSLQGIVQSPIRGSKENKTGNLEFLAHFMLASK